MSLFFFRCGSPAPRMICGRFPARRLSRERGDARTSGSFEFRNRRVRKVRILESDMNGTVQPFLHDHSIAFVYGRLLCWSQLEPLVFELDRKIVVHSALSPHREDRRQSLAKFISELPVRVAFLSWGNNESFVVIRKVRVFEKAVRPAAIFDIHETHLFHQTILHSPEETLDSSLGLWRVCTNDPHTELSHRALKLRQHLRIVDSVLVIHLVRTEFIEVYDARKAVRLDIRPPEAEHGMDALVVVEDGAHDGAGRVVDRSQETLLLAVLQPVVVAAVELNEFSVHGYTLAPLSVDAGASASVLIPVPFLDHEPAQRLKAEHDAFLLHELLHGERGTEVVVFFLLEECFDASDRFLIGCVVRDLAFVAVDDALFVVFFHSPF